MIQRKSLPSLLALALVLTAAAGCNKIMSTIVLPIYSKLTPDVPEVSQDMVIFFALYTVHDRITYLPYRDEEAVH